MFHQVLVDENEEIAKSNLEGQNTHTGRTASESEVVEPPPPPPPTFVLISSILPRPIIITILDALINRLLSMGPRALINGSGVKLFPNEEPSAPRRGRWGRLVGKVQLT